MQPIISSAVTGVLYRWLYHPVVGYLNYWMVQLGLVENMQQAPNWLGSKDWALLAVIIATTWRQLGFNVIVALAGVQNIDETFYDAAKVDGAGIWQRIRHITLPLLSPTIYFLTLYSVIGTFKAFNHIYVLRTGAALGTTDTASVVIFQTFQRDTRYGYASALAILLLLVIIMLTVVNNRIAARRVHYG